MKALRIKKIVHALSLEEIPFQCDDNTTIYLDDRGSEEPGADCIIILDEYMTNGIAHDKVDFVINNKKYCGWFYKTKNHEFAITMIVPLVVLRVAY